MAIYLHRVVYADSPLHSLSEAVLLIPSDGPLVVKNATLKIVCMLEGNVEMRVDDGPPSLVRPGDTIIVNGPLTQRYRPVDEEQPYIHALIFKLLDETPCPGQSPTAKLLERYLCEVLPINAVVATRHSAAFWELTTRMRYEFEKRKPSSEEAIHHLSVELLLHLAEIAGRQSTRHFWQPELPINNAFGTLLQQLTHHSSSAKPVPPLSLPTSPALDTAATHLLGISCGALYRKMQIEAAKFRLSSTTHSITRIAKHVGFNSLATFYRQFRQFTGIPPASYRTRRIKPLPSEGSAPRVVAFPPQQPSTWKLLSPSHQEPICAPGLLLLLTGAGTLRIGRTTVQLEIGRALAIPDTTASQLPHIEYDGSLAYLVLKPPFAPTSTPFLLPPLPAAKVAFLKEALSKPDRSLHEQLGLASLSALLRIAAVREGQQKKAPASTTPSESLSVAHAQEYIRKNHQRSIKLSEIAWAVGLSEEHLARQFHAAYKETVMSFLKRYRIARARHLLKHTSLPLEQVADQAGFSTTGLFFRAFKAEEGCTPGTFRRNWLKARECEE